MKIFFLLGCIAAGLSVALGAFGAHGLENKISAKMLEVWKQVLHIKCSMQVGYS